MKICPICGHLEMEYWRQNRWRTNVEFTTFSEFERNYPDLAKKIHEGTQVDKYSAYRLSGSKKRKIVERVLRSEYETLVCLLFISQWNIGTTKLNLRNN